MEVKSAFSPLTRLISLVLSLLILFYVTPITVSAKAPDSENSDSEEAVGAVASDADELSSALGQLEGIHEVESLRSENVKHFRLPDGSYVAAEYNFPVHYLTENGTFEDINNTLASSGSEFSTGDSRIKFAKKITGNENIFTLHDGNTKITFGLEGARKKTEGIASDNTSSDENISDLLGKMTNLENISSSIIYRDILDGVDIEYVIHSLNIKENIIVKERADVYTYVFTLELNNLEATLSSDGNVYVKDKSNITKYVIPAPVVFDAENVRAPESVAGYTLVEVGNGKYELSVSVSSEWMNDEARAFPVTIDPPIEGARGSVIDLYIDKNAPNNTGTTFGDYLEVTRTKISYIKFSDSTLSSIPQGAMIARASLNIIGKRTSVGDPIVGVYPVTTSWNGLLTYNKTQSPTYEGQLGDSALDYAVISESDIRYDFDITEAYEGWINGEGNYGIALKLLDESVGEYAKFISYDYSPGVGGDSFYEPILLVSYVYNDGIEGYFPTSSHSAGFGGTGSINLATGRLTLAIPTLTATDGLFGFTPTLVYNSSLAGKPLTSANIISPFATTYLPYGFKLNLQEFIQEKSYIDSEGVAQSYYALYDADGTTHTFYDIGDEIRDDSGLGFKLTFENGNIVITDKSHTKKTYTAFGSSGWYLTKVTDKLGNELIFKFDSQNRPTAISVKPIDYSEINMLSFVYDGDILCAVYDDTAKRAVIFRYSATPSGSIVTSGEKYLRNVEYYYGDSYTCEQDVWERYVDHTFDRYTYLYASASYTYDQAGLGYIAKITDNTENKSIVYGITQGRITRISEIAGNTMGQEISIDYHKGYTFINSSGNDESLGTSDDMTTQYVLDRYGRAVAINSYNVELEMIYRSSVGVYGEFQAVAKNSLVETANFPSVGSFIDGDDEYFATVDGSIGESGVYEYEFYDRSKHASVDYSEVNKFRISGLAKANSVIQNEYADFSLKVRITYTNGVERIFSFDFADVENEWQMASGNIDCDLEDGQSTLWDISEIDIICSYSGQLNAANGASPEAIFDQISFIETTDIDTTKYVYDANGNIAVMYNGTYTEYYEYDINGNVTRIANNRGEMYEYHYNSNNVLANEWYYSFHRIGSFPGNLLYVYPYDADLIQTPQKASTQGFRDAIDSQLLATAINRTYYTSNKYGLLLTVNSSKGEGTTVGGTLSSSYTYVDGDTGEKSYDHIFGAMLTSTDSRGHVTRYFYDQMSGSLLAEIDVSSGSGYVYSYDGAGRLEGVAPASGNATSYSSVSNAEKVEYTYDSAHRLSSITTDSTVYTFTYDSFGNSSSVAAGNNTLATYEYNQNNGKLKKISYGNGFSEEYVYDNIEKLKEVWYNYSNGTRVKAYSYEYSDSGYLESFTNHQNGEVITYAYDYNGRFISSSETKASNQNYKNQYSVEYDNYGRVIRATNLIDYLASSTSYNTSTSTYYEYNNDGTLKYENTTLPGSSIRSDYTYDELSRLTSVSSTSGSFSHTVDYTYYSSSTKTANLVSTYKSTVNGTATTFGYTYDSKGNITNITQSTGSSVSYTYDDLGQLIKEVRGNTTLTYSYDNAGNITAINSTTSVPGFGSNSKPTSVSVTKNLGYSNSEWGDLLTSFDGHTITYDGIGNPLSYYNGSSYTFTWEGRRLVGAVKSSKTMSFEYNDEGIRTSKTVNGVTTNYYVNGGQIVAESNNSRTIVYIYDASGSPIGMLYRTPSYAANTFDVFWYEKNLQGDIVAVYNSSGTKLVSYNYTDAWGNHSISYSNGGASTGAQYNPFRYRGYYYDTDLYMYYLQSRYYDAKICRFISADAVVGQFSNVQGANMFAYSFNNPVNMFDPAGNWPQLSTILQVVAVGATVVAVVALGVALAGLATVAVAGGGTMLVATATTTAALGVAATAGKVALVATGAAIITKTAENAYNNLPRNHTVYGLKDPSTGRIEYVGRTTNLDKRRAAHKSNPARQHLEMVTLATGLSAFEARGVEQIQMLFNHTINTADKMNNQINGISPSNSKLEVYMEAGRGALSYLENQISNEILYWTGK